MTIQEELQAWFDDELEDDELSPAAIKELERRVNTAAHRKVTAIPGVFILPEDRNIQ